MKSYKWLKLGHHLRMRRALGAALWLVIGSAARPKKAATPEGLNDGGKAPPPVIVTMRKEAAGAKVESVASENEDGVEAYEAMWHVNGRKVEVTVKLDGTLLEREDEVKPEEVPEAVRTAASTALAGAQTIAWVKLNTGNFEAEATVGGKSREVVIDATARSSRPKATRQGRARPRIATKGVHGRSGRVMLER